MQYKLPDTAMRHYLIRKVSLKTIAIASLLLNVFTTAVAKDYIVEVIVFENTSDYNVTEPHAYQAPKKPRTNGKAWFLETTLLTQEARNIANSSRYDLRHHFAWGQVSLPYNQSTTYTMVERDTQGYIKIYADQLLFANIDLDYKGFRMIEKRRLKLNEKHYFDHPKFGVLLQVSRLEPNTPPVEEGGA